MSSRTPFLALSSATAAEDYVADHKGKQVISAEAAYMSSTLMQYCVEGPYFNYMQVLKRSYPVYAKTGTTD